MPLILKRSLQIAGKEVGRYSINLGVGRLKKAPGLDLQQLAQYLNRDSSLLCRLIKRAKKSQDLETKAEKLLQVALSQK